ncbi:hypothetical protein L3X38_036765 [Prunus dulcis]|uniref:Aminotransferase-like plant mobile domain-containing protein n=1 Tax=Prunus dulcis TaxID=3755 RepID=A0AAD4V2D4_PRUDU|nr:hypothetical protein L3X38_036765 [Prunus dulcis]
MLPRFFLKIDVSNVDLYWVDWVKRMEPQYKNSWLDNGIYCATVYLTVQLQVDSPFMGSALMLWNSASNTFNFGVGSMSISILDLAVIFGFRPHGRSADWLGDFQDDYSKDKERRKNLEILSSIIDSSRA